MWCVAIPLFGIEGWRHYLKRIRGCAKHFDGPFRLDLTGKHVLVTGANEHRVRHRQALASQKANVHMVCRSKEREKALAKLREVAEQSGGSVDGANVRLHVCDISSMAAVKALTDAVKGGDPLHVLVNNADAWCTSAPPRRRASRLTATNTLRTWALTEDSYPR